MLKSPAGAKSGLPKRICRVGCKLLFDASFGNFDDNCPGEPATDFFNSIGGERTSRISDPAIALNIASRANLLHELRKLASQRHSARPWMRNPPS